jgi:hypothetical protein
MGVNVDEILKRIAELEARVDDLESQKRGKRFAPPTVDEVRAYCAEKSYTFDPEAFHAFYESKSWKVGSAKMKCWKSSCVTWQKREVKKNEGSKSAYQERIESDSARANDFAAARDF